MRAFTKREKLIKFVGCYHGHADSFLVQAGSGVATLGLPDSPGVPAASTGASLSQSSPWSLSGSPHAAWLRSPAFFQTECIYMDAFTEIETWRGSLPRSP